MLAAFVGCEGSSPYFVLNEKTKDLIPSAQQAVEKQLREDFGDPLHLVAWEKLPIDYGKVNKDEPAHAEPGWKLKTGRNLYMQHCIHCHGVTGDGNGPTAKFLNPRPRDYRQGKFKFTSTISGLKPSRDDLRRILQQGVAGTSMPSFVLLKDDELSALVEYVRWLSIRGEYELKLAAELSGMGASEQSIIKAIRDSQRAREETQKAVRDAETKVKEAKDDAAKKDAETALATAREEEKKADTVKTRDAALKEAEASYKDEFAGSVESSAGILVDDWTKADDPESVVIPTVKRVDPTKESLEIGRLLFHDLYKDPKTGKGVQTKCADCHGRTAEGNGVQTEQYWPVQGTIPQRNYAEAGLHDDWGNLIIPRNLTRGQYRGGRRPLDVFRRIHAGIKGTPMPAFGKTVLTDEQIWHVVNYVMSLPFGGKESAHPEAAPAARPNVASTSH
jgi:mono/diheme cytochrome c family protein